MEWIKINRDKLPDNEVLAANFEPRTFGYTEKLLGSLHIDNGIVCCENSNEILENCTHYIDIHKHDIKQ